ncbi:8802_t:CDS:2 [Paraglomus brasilianum]|uniref:8802_t:CDS:1 n=1 Tax=Paraglomus brasilianum TaxID=144538 RepID=A0A9N9EYE3_9GLOM|nr:8802_t:CDS:2 [Paraglomus brasilianum]
MVLALPNEIIQSVLFWLKESPEIGFKLHNIFYQCALISKAWNVNTTPLLYSRPFVAEGERKYLIITALLSSLDTKHRTFLETNNVNLSCLYSRPLYKYLSFIKHLDTDEMFSCVRNWYIWTDQHGVESNVKRTVLTAIHEIMRDLNVRLETLYMTDDCEFALNALIEYKDLFRHTKTLSMQAWNSGHIFKELSQSVNNLETLRINIELYKSAPEYIALLFRSLPLLKTVTLMSSEYYVEGVCGWLMNHPTLQEFHAILLEVNMEALKKLLTCKALNRLKLEFCKEMSEEAQLYLQTKGFMCEDTGHLIIWRHKKRDSAGRTRD